MSRLTPEQQEAFCLWFHRGPEAWRALPREPGVKVDFQRLVHETREKAKRAQRRLKEADDARP